MPLPGVEQAVEHDVNAGRGERSTMVKTSLTKKVSSTIRSIRAATAAALFSK